MAFSATPHDGHVRAERLLKIPAEPSPELLIPGAASSNANGLPGPEFDSDPGNPRDELAAISFDQKMIRRRQSQQHHCPVCAGLSAQTERVW
jgi:hypothetical protein